MLIAIHELKRYAHCYTWSEALCSMLYQELIAIQGVKRYVHCYIRSEAMCSLLYME